MAFAGVLISFGLKGVSVSPGFTPNLMGMLKASQSMASPGTTTISAPANDLPIIMRVAAAADIYLAYGGQTPDATNGPRVLVRAGTTEDFIVQNGDKAAWILVP